MNEDLRREIETIVTQQLAGRQIVNEPQQGVQSRNDQYQNVQCRNEQRQPTTSISRSNNIIAQTRAMIRASTESVASHSPRHPLRVSSGKKRKMEKVFEVVVMKKNDSEEYVFTEDIIVVKQVMVTLNNAMTEMDIRKALEKSLKHKLSLIYGEDLMFMKRDRNTILKPCVEEEFQWDFQSIKRLSGQGKLYVALKLPLSIVNNQSDDSDDVDLEPALFDE